jgi:hypothetical protein
MEFHRNDLTGPHNSVYVGLVEEVVKLVEDIPLETDPQIGEVYGALHSSILTNHDDMSMKTNESGIPVVLTIVEANTVPKRSGHPAGRRQSVPTSSFPSENELPC